MKKIQIMLIGLAITSLLLVSVAPALAAVSAPGSTPTAGGSPHFINEPNNTTLSIGSFSVRLVSQTNLIFLFWDTTEPTVRYVVHLSELIEFDDADEDNIVDTSERAPQRTLPLNAGTWVISEIVNETEGSEVKAIHFNYTLDGITLPQFAGVKIQFNFHLYTENTTVEEEGIETLVIGGYELKFDIIIGDWPWVAEGNALALRMILSSTTGRMVQHRNMLQNNAMVWERAQNSDNASAYFRFTDQVALRNNTSFQLGNLSYGIEENGTSPALYLVYPYFGNDTLVHDPTIGLTVTATEQPIIPSISDIITSPYFIGGLTIVLLVASFVVIRGRKH